MTTSDGSPADKPVLLSGGNPQIPKGDGDAPVAAYLAAMPEWKGVVGRRLDELINQALPDAKKAVRWNSPFYGTEEQGWLISYHCFTKYVKVTFFNGSKLDPEPPESGKDENARFLHVGQHDEIDADQFTSWVRQATTMPGWHF